jgi:hypothetical protein
MSHTFEFLEVSDIFYKRGQSLLNLLLRLMKASYLVMIQTLMHTMFFNMTTSYVETMCDAVFDKINVS